MNYQIIKDRDKFIEFIDWLPELKKNEVFYVTLFARNKYSSLIKGDKAQLKRLTTDKKFIYDKIKQLECAIGSYKSNGIEVPQEALALYINPNPRDLFKASNMTLVELAKNSYSDRILNPQKLALTALQDAIGTKHFIDFDFDKCDLDLTLFEISKYLNKDAYDVLKTKNGFHLLVKPSKIDKQYNKSWYLNITQIEGCDKTIKSDKLMPVAGCTQGDFIPHFII